MRYKILLLIGTVFLLSLFSVNAVTNISACGVTLATTDTYELTQSINGIGAGGNCINVQGSGTIILDCKGFSINTNIDTPIREHSASSLLIKNCLINSSSNKPAIEQIFNTQVTVTNSTIISSSTSANSKITDTSDTSNDIEFINSTIITGNKWFEAIGSPSGGATFKLTNSSFGNLDGDLITYYSMLITTFVGLIFDVNDLDINFNKAFVNSSFSKFSDLNTSATITFKGLNDTTHNATFASDDVSFSICNLGTDPACEILSDSGGTLVYNVTHFSSFSSQEVPSVPDPIVEDLISYWTFDTADINSTHALDTIGNFDLLRNQVAEDPVGKVNQAFNFDVTDTLTNTPNYDLSNDKITVAMWVKNTDQFGVMLDYVGIFGIRIENDILGVSVKNPSVEVSASTAVNLGGFKHVVGTFNGTTLKVYVDGVLDGTSSPVQNLLSTTGVLFRLGTRNSGLDPYAGVMDEVAIWNRTLSDSEVFTIFNRSNNGLHYNEGFVPPVVDTPVAITTLAPSNDTTIFKRATANVDFDFRGIDDVDSNFSCSLFIDNSLITTNSTVLNDTATTFTRTFTSADNGIITWNIRCTDSLPQESQGENRTLTINIIDDTNGATVAAVISSLLIFDSADIQGGNNTITTGQSILFNADYQNLRTGEQENFAYTNICFGSTQNTSVAFYKASTWLFRLFVLYIFIYIGYLLFFGNLKNILKKND